MTTHNPLRSDSERPVTVGAAQGHVKVRLAKDLVPLLSQQLYQSPLKAIEELVVNAWDADARECAVSIELTAIPSYVTISDDGVGMDLSGLQALWMIGRSPKRQDDEYKKRVVRTQIGKFGIGKLAASAIANTITYVSRVDNAVRLVTLDFRDFDEQQEDFELSVIEATANESAFKEIIAQSSQYGCLDLEWFETRNNWTHCILTNLKDKAASISPARLRWVLATAMPISDDFMLSLDGEKVRSSKDETPLFTYRVGNFEADRIERVQLETGTTFTVKDGKLYAPLFPSGVVFSASVYNESLNTGKSADLGRSYGFFVRVRNRLVNERDPQFGMSPRAFSTWNRFRATIETDDLDDLLTAPREGVEDAPKREVIQVLAREIFNACRARHDAIIAQQFEDERSKREIGRNPVSSRLIEMPVADALQQYGGVGSGADADASWFYLGVPDGDLTDVIRSLYSPRVGLYKYRLENLGAKGRLARYVPEDLTFILNDQHELVREYSDDFQSYRLLQDIVTAEAMLEVYMREAGIAAYTVGAVLEERDKLLRALAKHQSYSLKNVAIELTDARASEYDLEIAVVAAMRAFGFVAKHVSGSGKPDGIARYYTAPGEIKKITLEAKSTASNWPSLGAIDFAGLEEHKNDEGASGCILVAPGYPGSSDELSAAASRAKQAKISCWTIKDLASVVSAAEDRQITAAQIASLIETAFAPGDVAAAVQALLAMPDEDTDALERLLVDKIAETLPSNIGAPLDISYLHALVNLQRPGVQRRVVEAAAQSLAAKSGGLIRVRGHEIVLLGDVSEVRRRAWNGVGEDISVRRGGGGFKSSPPEEF